MSFNTEQIEACREYLGEYGIEFFQGLHESEGTLLSAHLREGMAVRNFMRESGLFSLDCHWLDDNWMLLVLKVIQV